MVMTEVHLNKRTDGGRFKNSMRGSEESGYGNLVKKCQALITSPHSKSFLAGLVDSDCSLLILNASFSTTLAFIYLLLILLDKFLEQL